MHLASPSVIAASPGVKELGKFLEVKRKRKKKPQKRV